LRNNAATEPRDAAWRRLAEVREAKVSGRRGTMERVHRLSRRHPAAALLVVMLMLYVLPTLTELAIFHRVSPWMSVIVFGDLTGCVCLGLLRMPATGLVLYLALGACEACLYAGGLIPANTLVWLVDVIPMLVVAGRLVYLRSTARTTEAPC